MTKDELIEELILSEIKSLHHVSLHLKRKILERECHPKLQPEYAKAAAKVSREIFHGIGMLQRHKNKNTQFIKVEKIIIHQNSNTIIGGVQVDGTATTQTTAATQTTQATDHNKPQEDVLQTIANGNGAYLDELCQQAFFEQTIDCYDEYAEQSQPLKEEDSIEGGVKIFE